MRKYGSGEYISLEAGEGGSTGRILLVVGFVFSKGHKMRVGYNEEPRQFRWTSFWNGKMHSMINSISSASEVVLLTCFNFIVCESAHLVSRFVSLICFMKSLQKTK